MKAMNIPGLRLPPSKMTFGACWYKYMCLDPRADWAVDHLMNPGRGEKYDCARNTEAMFAELDALGKSFGETAHEEPVEEQD